MTASLEGKSVYVAGHIGLVGSALMRRLARENCRIVTAARGEVDLRDPVAVPAFLGRTRPDVVIVAAAKVGGIHANTSQPADFIYDNLVIASNLIEASHRSDIQHLLFLGSSCIYPRLAAQPMNEDALLTGPLEPTNEWYAIAKIAGIKMCQAYRRQHGRNYISCQPSNLYGPNDNFSLSNSHVLPALLRKTHEAKLANAASMEVWGSGTPRREFLHVDDLADACIFLVNNYSGDVPLNIGWGMDYAISEVAELIRSSVGFEGAITYNRQMPDGMPRKLLDTARLNALGWSPRITLEDGLKGYYDWFLRHQDNLRDA